MSPAVAAAFHKKFPSVETFTRMVILGPDGVLTYQDRYTGEENILLADSAFFDVFSYRLLQGNTKTALNEPFGVVITESTAQRLFQDEDPLGKTIVINAENFDRTSMPFKITGVMENFPKNSHLHPRVLISYPTLYEFVGHQFDESWQWNETYTYIRLHSGTNPVELESGFPEVVHRFNKELQKEKLDWRYRLQPITDIHLHSHLQHEASVNANALYIYFLLGVGVLIIIIAYINFVNLTTIKALQRAKEVGISIGCQSWTFDQAVFSGGIGNKWNCPGNKYCVVADSYPVCSSWFDVSLAFGVNELLLAFGFLIMLLVLGSGFYPAFILSVYKPTKVLKGDMVRGSSGSLFRKFLVVGQFCIAIILIALTNAAILQVRHMQQQSLGFNPEQTVIVKGPKSFNYGYANNFSAFQSKATSLRDIKSVSGSGAVPGQEIYWYDDQIKLDGQETSGVFSVQPVAQNYFAHYNISLISGRNFTEPSREKWIVNETAMTLLGLQNADNAVGAKLNNGEIIGVVQDFHHESLKTDIQPMMFFCGNSFNYYAVKINGFNVRNSLVSLEEAYKELFPGSPYSYFFLNEYFDRQYKTDRQFSELFNLFSGLAILIAGLGLFGLSSYMTVQRSKEIGIRKVMGASVKGVVVLLSRDYIKLVMIASVVALPVSYLVIERWLENYAFRIDITGWLLFFPIAAVFLLTLFTVSIQTLRTALINPASSLRYE